MANVVILNQITSISAPPTLHRCISYPEPTISPPICFLCPISQVRNHFSANPFMLEYPFLCLLVWSSPFGGLNSESQQKTFSTESETQENASFEKRTGCSGYRASQRKKGTVSSPGNSLQGVQECATEKLQFPTLMPELTHMYTVGCEG